MTNAIASDEQVAGELATRIQGALGVYTGFALCTLDTHATVPGSTAHDDLSVASPELSAHGAISLSQMLMPWKLLP